MMASFFFNGYTKISAFKKIVNLSQWFNLNQFSLLSAIVQASN